MEGFATQEVYTTPANTQEVYTTPTNLSLLLHYYVDSGDFNTTLVSFGDKNAEWVNISEGSNLTLQRGFECFGDYETISENMPIQ